MSWHVLTWISFCSSPSRQGTSLVAITYIFILSFKKLWMVPNKIPNAFWTSQTEILLFFEDKFPHSVHIFICSAHQWISQMFSIFYTASELQKPLKNLCSFNSTFFKNYLQHFESFRTIFTSLSQILMQTCFLGTPKLQMGQHMCVFKQTLLHVQSQVPQLHSKQAVTQQPQHHLHSIWTVCASSSRSVIFTDDTPLCYLNSVIPYTNTTTVIIKTVLFLQNLLHVSANKAIICSILLLPSSVLFCNSCARWWSSWPNMYWIFVKTEMFFLIIKLAVCLTGLLENNSTVSSNGQSWNYLIAPYISPHSIYQLVFQKKTNCVISEYKLNF